MASESQQPKKAREPIPEQGWIRALCHPLRIEMLDLLTGEIMSPIGLSRCLDQSLSDVAYHMRALVKAECVELVDTQQVRGATKHFYLARPRSSFTHQLWRNIPRCLREHHTAGTLERLMRGAVASIDADVMDDDETVLSLVPVPVDEQGRLDTTKVLLAAQAEVEKISSDSLGRLGENKGQAVQLLVGLASFRAVPLSG